MPLPYENTTAGEKALEEIRKTLQAFGCRQFGYLIDDDERVVMIQFKYRERSVSFKASVRGYASMWLEEHPYSNRIRCTEAEHRERAMTQAQIAVFSILRDQIKGSIAAVQTGVMSFDAAFMGQIMLPGKAATVAEHIESQKLLGPPAQT